MIDASRAHAFVVFDVYTDYYIIKSPSQMYDNLVKLSPFCPVGAETVPILSPTPPMMHPLTGGKGDSFQVLSNSAVPSRS